MWNIQAALSYNRWPGNKVQTKHWSVPNEQQCGFLYFVSMPDLNDSTCTQITKIIEKQDHKGDIKHDQKFK